MRFQAFLRKRAKNGFFEKLRFQISKQTNIHGTGGIELQREAWEVWIPLA